MPRIFLSDPEIKPGPLTLTGEKAKYLSVVLRCAPGDMLVIKDNKGSSYSARITGVTRRAVAIDILERQDTESESSLQLTLLTGILKGEKMDLVIQKAAELGVKEIVPVITERGVVRETRKLPRWRKIAEEAARQCGRDYVPFVQDIIDFEQAIAGRNDGIIFWEAGGKGLRSLLRGFRNCVRIALLTGPEGGFSSEEVARASEKGFVAATLGRRILRAETAALAAVSIVQYELGDMGGDGDPKERETG